MTTLFIVPWPWAGRSSTAPASASSTVSAIRWLVSTLPATTAAGLRALTTLPSGAAIVERRVGAGVGRHVRRQQHAEGEEARGAGHRERAVDVAPDLTGAAGEVDRDLLALDPHLDPERHVRVVDAVALDLALGGVHAVGERARSRPARAARRRRSPPRRRPSRRRARAARPAPRAGRRRPRWPRPGRAGRRAGARACGRSRAAGRAPRRPARRRARAAPAGSRSPPGRSSASPAASSRASSRRRRSGARA